MVIFTVDDVELLVGGVSILFFADLGVDAHGSVLGREGDGGVEIDYIIISVVFIIIFLTHTTFTMYLIC